MSDPVTSSTGGGDAPRLRPHAGWVRTCHWSLLAFVLLLAMSGSIILKSHPRLYWGEAGNDLMPALLELPISDNHRPDGWVTTARFDELPGAPISAWRDYPIYNHNHWARSLHFLAGWLLVTTLTLYALLALRTGHLWRNLLPRLRDLRWQALRQELRKHLLAADVEVGPPYGQLQRVAYTGAVFVALPLMLLSGLTMAPAITAAWPGLLDLFGGYQSARTVHFAGFLLLVLFALVHVGMVVRTGLWRQLRAMLLGR